jgi:hypothetical protein
MPSPPSRLAFHSPDALVIAVTQARQRVNEEVGAVLIPLNLKAHLDQQLILLPMRLGYHGHAQEEPVVALFRVNAAGIWVSGHPQVGKWLSEMLTLPEVPEDVIHAVATAFWQQVRGQAWQGPWGRLEARFGELRLWTDNAVARAWHES